MTLGGMSTKPRPGTREHAVLADLRSGGYGVRFNDEDGVHRIVAPGARGMETVGLLLIRNDRIAYAEFNGRVFPWWGRPEEAALYDEALTNLEADVLDGRRK